MGWQRDDSMKKTVGTEAPPVPGLPELLALGAMFFGLVVTGTYMLKEE